MSINALKRIALALSILSIVAFAAAGASEQSKKDQKKAKQLVESGDKAVTAKDYAGAVNFYTQALTITPVNNHAHFWKGYSHYSLKQNEPAIQEFKLALDQGYKPVDVYKIRYLIYQEMQDYDSALGDIRLALAADPDDLDLLFASANINYEKKNYQEALDSFTKLTVKSPANGDNFYKIAQVQQALGNTEAAAAAAEEAIKRNTRSLGDAYFILGTADQKLRKNPEAIAAFQRALAAKQDNYSVYRSLAELYRSENRINEAIDITRKGLRAFPNDGPMYTDVSWYYSIADRHEDAVQAALAGIRFSAGTPTEATGYTNLCRAYNDLKKYELAKNACNSALKLNPNDGETYYYLARATDLLGKTADATAFYKKAVLGLIAFTQANADYSDGYYLLGNAYYADQQPEKATDAYRKCLELNPRFVKARYNLGHILVIQKNRTAAMTQYNALLTLDKDLAERLKGEIDKM